MKATIFAYAEKAYSELHAVALPKSHELGTSARVSNRIAKVKGNGVSLAKAEAFLSDVIQVHEAIRIMQKDADLQKNYETAKAALKQAKKNIAKVSVEYKAFEKMRWEKGLTKAPLADLLKHPGFVKNAGGYPVPKTQVAFDNAVDARVAAEKDLARATEAYKSAKADSSWKASVVSARQTYKKIIKREPGAISYAKTISAFEDKNNVDFESLVKAIGGLNQVYSAAEGVSAPTVVNPRIVDLKEFYEAVTPLFYLGEHQDQTVNIRLSRDLSVADIDAFFIQVAKDRVFLAKNQDQKAAILKEYEIRYAGGAYAAEWLLCPNEIFNKARVRFTELRVSASRARNPWTFAPENYDRGFVAAQGAGYAYALNNQSVGTALKTINTLHVLREEKSQDDYEIGTTLYAFNQMLKDTSAAVAAQMGLNEEETEIVAELIPSTFLTGVSDEPTVLSSIAYKLIEERLKSPLLSVIAEQRTELKAIIAKVTSNAKEQEVFTSIMRRLIANNKSYNAQDVTRQIVKCRFEMGLDKDTTREGIMAIADSVAAMCVSYAARFENAINEVAASVVFQPQQIVLMNATIRASLGGKSVVANTIARETAYKFVDGDEGVSVAKVAAMAGPALGKLVTDQKSAFDEMVSHMDAVVTKGKVKAVPVEKKTPAFNLEKIIESATKNAKIRKVLAYTAEEIIMQSKIMPDDVAYKISKALRVHTLEKEISSREIAQILNVMTDPIVAHIANLTDLVGPMPIFAKAEPKKGSRKNRTIQPGDVAKKINDMIGRDLKEITKVINESLTTAYNEKFPMGACAEWLAVSKEKLGEIVGKLEEMARTNPTAQVLSVGAILPEAYNVILNLQKKREKETYADSQQTNVVPMKRSSPLNLGEIFAKLASDIAIPVQAKTSRIAAFANRFVKKFVTPAVTAINNTGLRVETKIRNVGSVKKAQRDFGFILAFGANFSNLETVIKKTPALATQDNFDRIMKVGSDSVSLLTAAGAMLSINRNLATDRNFAQFKSLGFSSANADVRAAAIRISNTIIASNPDLMTEAYSEGMLAYAKTSGFTTSRREALRNHIMIQNADYNTAPENARPVIAGKLIETLFTFQKDPEFALRKEALEGLTSFLIDNKVKPEPQIMHKLLALAESAPKDVDQYYFTRTNAMKSVLSIIRANVEKAAMPEFQNYLATLGRLAAREQGVLTEQNVNLTRAISDFTASTGVQVPGFIVKRDGVQANSLERQGFTVFAANNLDGQRQLSDRQLRVEGLNPGNLSEYDGRYVQSYTSYFKDLAALKGNAEAEKAIPALFDALADLIEQGQKISHMHKQAINTLVDLAQLVGTAEYRSFAETVSERFGKPEYIEAMLGAVVKEKSASNRTELLKGVSTLLAMTPDADQKYLQMVADLIINEQELAGTFDQTFMVSLRNLEAVANDEIKNLIVKNVEIAPEFLQKETGTTSVSITLLQSISGQVVTNVSVTGSNSFGDDMEAVRFNDVVASIAGIKNRVEKSMMERNLLAPAFDAVLEAEIRNGKDGSFANIKTTIADLEELLSSSRKYASYREIYAQRKRAFAQKQMVTTMQTAANEVVSNSNVVSMFGDKIDANKPVAAGNDPKTTGGLKLAA